MNPRQFRNFVHSVLEDFGNNESIKDSTEEGEIIKHLESRVDARCYTLFGSHITVPLAYQIKSIKERLKWFSSIQARERSLGWKIIHSEFRIHNKRSIEIGGLKLRGTTAEALSKYQGKINGMDPIEWIKSLQENDEV